jgi:hypothetical protein
VGFTTRQAAGQGCADCNASVSNLQKQLLAVYARLRVAEGLCRTRQERETIDALQWLVREKSRKESARLAREKVKRDNWPTRVVI